MNRRDFVKLSSLALAGLGSKKLPSFSYRNLPPEVIQTNLVAWWHFIEGWNQVVFNRVNIPAYQNPPNMLGAYSEQFQQGASGPPAPWLTTGATLTDFFAAGPPPGNVANAATRLVTAGGSSLIFYTLTLANVPHTFSIYVKSNTGASQTVRLGNMSSPGGDQTVTTGWTQLSQTFTPAAGSVLVGVANDAAHDGMDILIYGAQLELGSSMGAYAPQALNLMLGLTAQVDSFDPTWVADGLEFGVSKFMKGISSAATTFSHITLYGVFKKEPGTDAPSFFEPILTSQPTPSPYGIIMESRDILNSGTSANSTGPCFGFGFTGHIVNAKNARIDDGDYHVFVGTYDGTNIKLYIDGVQCEQKAHTIASQTMHRFMLGCFEGNNSDATNYFPGTVGMLALYTDAHTSAQVRQNTTAMRGDMACRAIQMPVPTKFIGVEGDSLPAGLGIAQAERWSWLLLQSITPTIQQWNDAVGGSTVATCTSRAAVFNQVIDAGVALNLLIIELGANDMSGSDTAAQFVANLKAYCIAQKAAGWNKIAIVPVLNRGDIVGFDAKRNTANSLIAGDPDFTNGVAADAFITLSATIMAAAAVNDPALFQADKVHPTAFANSEYLFPGIEAGITPLL